MSFFSNLLTSIRRFGPPVSVGLSAVLVASFLVLLVAPSTAASMLLPIGSAVAPRQFLTFPIAAFGDPIATLFGVLWVWMVGAQLEQEMTSLRFLAFWFGYSLLTALVMIVGAVALHAASIPLSPWIPVAGITVLWATRWPNQNVRLYMILPIQSKWLGVLTTVVLIYNYGRIFPPMGFLAALPLILAWAIAAEKIPFLGMRPSASSGGFRGRSKALNKFDLQPPGFFEEVKRREKEREERERLRKLFERSLIEDPKDDRDMGNGK